MRDTAPKDQTTHEHKTTRPVVEIDYARYEELLDDPDLTDEQRREFLAALWHILSEFVALGFGVHPLQQAQETCGQNRKSHGDSGILDVDSVYLSHTELKPYFEGAASSSDAGSFEESSS